MEGFPRTPGALGIRKLAIVSFAALFAAGCSRTDVQVVTSPPPPPLGDRFSNVAPNRQTAAERLVAIDRLLAAPVTGQSDDSNQRTVLRAERAALVDSGQLPYWAQSQFATNRNQAVQPNPPLATVTTRAPNGDIVNYAPATTQNGRTVVVPNSHDRNLSSLEQMTPTERERYYKALRLQNTSRIDVNVRHH